MDTQENQNAPEQKTEKNLLALLSQQIFHSPTPAHGNKMRGKGITRKNKELSKAKLRTEKNSRKLNRNKKRHHKTSKEKRSR